MRAIFRTSGSCLSYLACTLAVQVLYMGIHAVEKNGCQDAEILPCRKSEVGKVNTTSGRHQQKRWVYINRFKTNVSKLCANCEKKFIHNSNDDETSNIITGVYRSFLEYPTSTSMIKLIRLPVQDAASDFAYSLAIFCVHDS